MRFTMRISQVLYTVQVKNIPHILHFVFDKEVKQIEKTDMKQKAAKGYISGFLFFALVENVIRECAF